MNINYRDYEYVLKHPFTGSGSVRTNHSQAFQDMFVLTMLDGKRDGRYLEIGSNDPIVLNNTCLLERQFGWEGISLEYQAPLVDAFNTQRSNVCYECDAQIFDWYGALRRKRWSGQIDYLSVDCEPAQITFNAMKNVPFDICRFSVITYEHDVYHDDCGAREWSREYFNSLGYQLVVSDLCNGGNPYEDWYVDPDVVPVERWSPFVASMVEAKDLFVTPLGS